MPKSNILLYLSFPLPIFWWGWFEWWIALPFTLGLLWILSKVINPLSFETPSFQNIKTLLWCIFFAFIWAYLAGVGGFRPQHYDYFKHNLIINNLVRYDWPVRYADGHYLCYYFAYYLPAAFLAKWVGGIGMVHYFIFGWTWWGVSLLFRLLHCLGGWKFIVFFLLFNSPEAVLWLYDIVKSPNDMYETLHDFWINDHTIELIQTPGGLMFPNHVESFMAAPQHSLPAWLTISYIIYHISDNKYHLPFNIYGLLSKISQYTPLFIKRLNPIKNYSKTEPPQNRHTEERPVIWYVLFVICLYWSPLVAVGLFPFIIYQLSFISCHSAINICHSKTCFCHSDKGEIYSFLRLRCLLRQYDKGAFLIVTLLALPVLVFYAGHVPLNEVQGWWWTFIKTPHQYVLLAIFILIEVVFWGLFVWFIEKKFKVLKQDLGLVFLALGILLGLALYRYGHFNDLARRASLPATLVVCWGVFLNFKVALNLFSNKNKIYFSLFILHALLLFIIPLKYHLKWLTKQPYTEEVDRSIKDFTPYSIHYLSRYHWGEFDVVAQYLGKADAWYMRYFTSDSSQLPKQVKRAFYYWKSIFELSDYEEQVLEKLDIKRLYIKFFDVDWDNATHQAVPKAIIHFKKKPPMAFTPTVFITNRTLEKLSWGGVDELAGNIIKKLPEIYPTTFDEIQFDCDWTRATRTKYFRLLQKIKSKLAVNTQLSATIRLHQIKFYRTAGIPPVARGMLMYYNMDDWKNPRTQNSILDLTVAGRYADYISDYPLALDVVLPVFSWAVVYRNGKFFTFINQLTHKDLQSNLIFKKTRHSNQYIALRHTSAYGISIRAGDVFRVEESHFQDLKISTQTLSQEIQNRRVTFALYHLDSLNLAHYGKDSLQQVFQSFR